MIEDLTALNWRLLNLLADGYSQREAARILSMELKSVENMTYHIRRKVGTATTRQAVRLVFCDGLNRNHTTRTQDIPAPNPVVDNHPQYAIRDMTAVRGRHGIVRWTPTEGAPS